MCIFVCVYLFREKRWERNTVLMEKRMEVNKHILHTIVTFVSSSLLALMFYFNATVIPFCLFASINHSWCLYLVEDQLVVEIYGYVLPKNGERLHHNLAT